MFLPVSIDDELEASQCGSDNPKNVENPKISRLREEFMLTLFRLETPAAVIIPKVFIIINRSLKI